MKAVTKFPAGSPGESIRARKGSTKDREWRAETIKPVLRISEA
jgi:hypothetical protein